MKTAKKSKKENNMNIFNMNKLSHSYRENTSNKFIFITSKKKYKVHASVLY